MANHIFSSLLLLMPPLVDPLSDSLPSSRITPIPFACLDFFLGPNRDKGHLYHHHLRMCKGKVHLQHLLYSLVTDGQVQLRFQDTDGAYSRISFNASKVLRRYLCVQEGESIPWVIPNDLVSQFLQLSKLLKQMKRTNAS